MHATSMSACAPVRPCSTWSAASPTSTSPARHFDLAEDVAQRIAAESGLIADSWIRTNAQFVTALTSQRVSSNVIRFFIALSVSFGIASVLVVSVVQRSKEIGILRAMGASRRRRYCASSCCRAASWASSDPCSARRWRGLPDAMWRMLARNPDGTPMFDIDVEPALVAIAAGGASVVGILAALLPARRAGRARPGGGDPWLNAVLKLGGLRKSYAGADTEYEVLHGIDLRLGRGEFAALIGPSGSGKSTLLNLIGLLDRPSRAASSSMARRPRRSTTPPSPACAASASASCSSTTT
jgi:hypothetical protein